jgi:hypothetical protein
MGTLTQRDGHDPRVVRSSEGLAAGPERNGSLAGGLSAVAEAAQEAADAFTADGAADYATTDLIRCDWCDLRKPSYEVLLRGDLLLCEDCRECQRDERTDRQIDLIRGK